MAKKTKSASETKMSLDLCRRKGWLVQKAEYWLPSFRIYDVITVAQQVCAGTAAKADLSKILSDYRSNPGARKDLFGFVDIVALTGEEGIIAIQSTSHSMISTRFNKIRIECQEAAMKWLESGGKIQIWGWHQPKGPRTAWICTVRNVSIADVNPHKPF